MTARVRRAVRDDSVTLTPSSTSRYCLLGDGADQSSRPPLQLIASYEINERGGVETGLKSGGLPD
jgi:hypothetical protein